MRPLVGALVVTAALALGPTAAPASALGVCDLTGLVSGAAGKACTLVKSSGKVISAGKKLLGGHVGKAVGTLVGGGGSPTASTALGLAAIGAWVIGGATVALHETAKVLGATTSPSLQSAWFSSAYWRMTGLAAVLTVPFLFAAAIQALLRSDLALLVRATLGYLPLALLTVSIAAPVTMLLLAATDQMSAIVSSAAGDASSKFLAHAGVTLAALTVLSGSPFIAFLVGLFTAAGALVLWIELLMREAAVYVIVLMLPLVFAAMVWPARRIWAVRAVELLVALILSKFAIVVVLALGGAALSHNGGYSLTGSLAGLVLVLMGVFAPWALLRLVPLTEIASGAVGSLRSEGTRAIQSPMRMASVGAERAHDRWGQDFESGLTAEMQRQAEQTPGLPAPRAGADGDESGGGKPGGGKPGGGKPGGDDQGGGEPGAHALAEIAAAPGSGPAATGASADARGAPEAGGADERQPTVTGERATDLSSDDPSQTPAVAGTGELPIGGEARASAGGGTVAIDADAPAPGPPETALDRTDTVPSVLDAAPSPAPDPDPDRHDQARPTRVGEPNPNWPEVEIELGSDDWSRMPQIWPPEDLASGHRAVDPGAAHAQTEDGEPADDSDALPPARDPQDRRL
jgi:hypothetical protein